MEYIIRKIEEKDNQKIEKIIRDCLIEFGGNHEGTAWADPNLSHLYDSYQEEGNCYFVVESNGEVIAGAGVKRIEIAGYCEIQKMYCMKEYRGNGIGKALMNKALEYAKKYYDYCYLESMDSMTVARSMYQKMGFEKLDEPIVDTGHYGCNNKYLKRIK